MYFCLVRRVSRREYERMERQRLEELEEEEEEGGEAEQEAPGNWKGRYNGSGHPEWLLGDLHDCCHKFRLEDSGMLREWQDLAPRSSVDRCRCVDRVEPDVASGSLEKAVGMMEVCGASGESPAEEGMKGQI